MKLTRLFQLIYIALALIGCNAERKSIVNFDIQDEVAQATCRIEMKGKKIGVHILVRNKVSYDISVLNSNQLFLYLIGIEQFGAQNIVAEILFGDFILSPYDPYHLANELPIKVIKPGKSLRLKNYFSTNKMTGLPIRNAYLCFAYSPITKQIQPGMMSNQIFMGSRTIVESPNLDTIFYPPTPNSWEYLEPTKR